MPTMPPPDSFIKVEVMRAELTAPPEDLLSLPSVLSGSANTRVAISTGNGAATTQNKAAGGEAIKWAETFALPFFSGKDSTVRFAVEKCSGGVAGELLGEATLRGADFAKGVTWMELRKPSSRDVRLGGKSPQSDSKLLRFRAGATGAAASAGTRAGRIEVRVQLLELGALSMAQAKTLIDVFGKCDPRNTGELTRPKLVQGMQRLSGNNGGGLSSREAQELWDVCDADRSGTVSLQEFLAAVAPRAFPKKGRAGGGGGGKGLSTLASKWFSGAGDEFVLQVDVLGCRHLKNPHGELWFTPPDPYVTIQLTQPQLTPPRPPPPEPPDDQGEAAAAAAAHAAVAGAAGGPFRTRVRGNTWSPTFNDAFVLALPQPEAKELAAALSKGRSPPRGAAPPLAAARGLVSFNSLRSLRGGPKEAEVDHAALAKALRLAVIVNDRDVTSKDDEIGAAGVDLLATLEAAQEDEEASAEAGRLYSGPDFSCEVVASSGVQTLRLLGDRGEQGEVSLVVRLCRLSSSAVELPQLQECLALFNVCDRTDKSGRLRHDTGALYRALLALKQDIKREATFAIWAAMEVSRPPRSFRSAVTAEGVDAMTFAAKLAPRVYGCTHAEGAAWLAVLQGASEAAKWPMGLAQPRWIAQSERMRLKQIFEACDDDRSGELSKGELKEGLARLGMPPGDEEMDQLWQAVDSDGSGALSLEEFVVAVSTLDEQMRDRGVGAKVVGGTMGLMGDLSFFVRNTAAPMRQFLAEQHQSMKDKIEAMMLSVEASVIAGAVDTDMPDQIKHVATGVVRGVMPDLSAQVKGSLLPASSVSETLSSLTSTQRVTWNTRPWSKVRAEVLHGMLPCDRTLFRCSKDPLALSLYLCSFWPDNGIWQLVWVSSFLLRDRSDEYQLTSFILGFKGMQFVTLGILGATNGIIAYFGCVGAAAHAAAAAPPGAALPVACAEGGPGSSDNFVASLLFFVAEVYMLYHAFNLLPHSKQLGGFRPKPSEDGGGGEAETVVRPGGRLTPLKHYELVVFSACSALAALQLHAFTNGEIPEWRLRSSLYWLQTLYGAFALPYLFFKMPVFSMFLCLATPTGYDADGNCTKMAYSDPADRCTPPAEIKPPLGPLRRARRALLCFFAPGSDAMGDAGVWAALTCPLWIATASAYLGKVGSVAIVAWAAVGVLLQPNRSRDPKIEPNDPRSVLLAVRRALHRVRALLRALLFSPAVRALAFTALLLGAAAAAVVAATGGLEAWREWMRIEEDNRWQPSELALVRGATLLCLVPAATLVASWGANLVASLARALGLADHAHAD